MDYIDLQRTFRPLQDTDDREEVARVSYLHFSMVALTWDELLKSKIVVVLAEAGSGKTWEFQAFAQRTDKPERPTFLMQLQALTDGAFEDAIRPDDADRVRKWLKTDHDAVFLLDSVDESRIRSTEGFRTALRRFRHGIGKASSRVRVILSSRVSEWRHNTDTVLVCDELGLGRQQAIESGRTAETPGFRAVLLTPLSDDQVERLAMARLGSSRAEEFISALTAASAWDFARRPLDAVELIEFWNQHTRLGSLPEIIEAAVERKLRPRSDRDELSPLAPERARQGAERLAAATLLGKQLSFQVPEDSPPSAVKAAAMSANEVLSDWPQNEVRTLLGRPLFDPAAFGRIRFHHRLTAEYLAAQWLIRRVEAGCPEGQIEALLLPLVRGRRVLVPSLAEATAWICQMEGNERWRVRLRNMVLNVAPAALVGHGDPRLLPLDIKRNLLRAGLRGEADFSFDAHCLERLAEPGLAADLQAMLSPDADEAQVMLALRILWHGRLVAASDAVPEAVRLALSPGVSSDIRLRAIHAVEAAGSPQQRRALARELPASSPTMAMATDAVNSLHPHSMGTAELLALAAAFPEVSMFGGTGLPQAIAAAVPSVPEAELADFVRQLAGLAAPHVSADSRPPGSIPFGWLAEPMVPALERILSHPTLDASQTIAAADGLDVVGPLMLNWQRGSRRNTTLQVASQNHPALREEILSRLFGPSRNASDFPWHHSVRWCREDLIVLSRWIASEQDLNRKIRLLGLASTGWHWTGRHAVDRTRLLRAALCNPGAPDTARLLPGRLQLWISTLRSRAHQERAWRLRERLARGRFWIERLRLWWLYIRHLRALATGRWSHALADLAHGWLDERRVGRSNSPRYPDFPDPLHLVRKAALRGWQRRWRLAQIKLPNESGSMIEQDLLIGLAGFEANLDDGLDMRAMTAAESEVVARMAARTLYGLPPWFSEFEQVQPAATQHVIEKCIASDWTLSEQNIRMLHVGGWSSQLSLSTRKAVQPFVARLLDEHCPYVEVLRTALELCLCTLTGRITIARLAPLRLQTLADDTGEYETWLWGWLHVDPRALEHLERLSREKHGAADDLLVKLTKALFGRRSVDVGGEFTPAFENVDALSRLIALLHEHVRPENDIRNGPGIHSYTERDEVQRIRDTLLHNLSQRNDPEVFGTLQSLRSHPAMQLREDWLERLIATRLGQEAEPEPWQPGQLPEFETTFETTPRTPQALFGLTLMRLDDIRRGVEHNDASTRNELNGSEPEEDLQRWLCGKLRSLSRGRYSAEREAETDRKKNPDIRLSVPGVCPVSLELKWAQDGSYSELRRALEHQLVEQYLRSPGLRFGALVLANGRTSRGNARRHWQPPEGGTLSFEELTIHLRQVARNILDTSHDVDGLEVISLNFL